eukprot:11197431-Lingulodinium_polyedra.AAC.1
MGGSLRGTAGRRRSGPSEPRGRWRSGGRSLHANTTWPTCPTAWAATPARACSPNAPPPDAAGAVASGGV